MRVLYLCHRVPYAPNRGDRIRAYHTLRYLRSAGVEVHLVALAHDDHEEAAASALDSLVSSWEVVRVPWLVGRLRAAMALTGSRPLTHVLLDGPGMRPALGRAVERFVPDVVLAYCSGMARFALEPPLSDLPLVLDMVDVDSEKWRALAARARWPLTWIYGREARRLGSFEARAARAARATVVINDRERQALSRLAPGAPVSVVGNGVDVEYFRPPADAPARAGVVFTAVFDYAPNVEGAAWLVERVWPMVRAAVPDASLLLVGARPSARVQALGRPATGVRVVGQVPDMRPYLWQARVGVAPLALSRGTQNKVLEGLAGGLAMVVTPAVAEGLPQAVLPWVAVGEDPDRFAAAIVRGLREPALAGAEAAVAGLAWTSALAPLLPLIADGVPA